MIRAHFEEHIRDLEKKLLDMGGMVIDAVRRSVESLKTQDMEKAESVMEEDKKTNRLRRDMEHECINLIATQQPVASDLREIISLLDIVSNLERMGDHAKGIAHITVMYGKSPLVKPLVDIPRMADRTCEMIKKSVQAFIDRDARAAKKIAEEDNEIDRLNSQVYRELLSFMIEDPKTITRATYLLWVSHNLERIADRVTNICEQILFMVKGPSGEQD